MKKITVFTAFVAMLFLASCNSKKELKEEETKFIVTNPLRIDTSLTKEYVSQIRSVRNIELRAQEKGFLQEIYVDEGQFVKAGQVLFKIMPKLYEAELLKAQSEAKAAEIELQNAKMLADKNVVSKNEQALANAKLQQARAEVSLAQLHLSFTKIKAPFDGYIDRIPKKLGSLIEEGELLTTLSDNSEMFAYFNVTEPEYLDYQMHAKNNQQKNIGLILANGELFNEKGRVELIESEFDNETGNIAFRARFSNSGKLLKHGETGKVQMHIPVKGAIIIPQKATYEIQDKKYVFVVGKNNVVESRNIEVSSQIPDLYIVSKGLTVNDKILLEGVQKAKDDDKIEFTYQDPKYVIKHLRTKAE